MDFGFGPLGAGATSDPALLAHVARTAEDAGFAELWAGDHTVFLDNYDSRYPYTADGRAPWAGGIDFLDPFMTLTSIAAHTERIRLGTGIYLPALRHPLLVAKQVASLDKLSGGRFDFGIGVGWLAEEFTALAVPFEDRVERTVEVLAAMKAVWSGAGNGFQGSTFSFGPVNSDPAPTQKPHPPIIFGGDSNAALRRAATLGDGWYGFNLTPDEAAAKVGRLRKLAAEAGRNAPRVVVGPPPGRPFAPDDAKRYEDAAVDHIVLTLVSPDAGAISDEVSRLAEIVSRVTA